MLFFKSVDTVINKDEVVNYPTEFFHSLELTRLPPNILQLKVGSVIIMLRKINQPQVCNGTRLAVEKLMNNVFEERMFIIVLAQYVFGDTTPDKIYFTFYYLQSSDFESDPHKISGDMTPSGNIISITCTCIVGRVD